MALRRRRWWCRFTCYTCHRGQPVPANVWFTMPPSVQAARMTGNDAGQNKAAEVVTFASLPYDPFTPYLLDNQPIRVLPGPPSQADVAGLDDDTDSDQGDPSRLA